MQILYKFIYITKLLIYGFYSEGLKALLKSIISSWISVCVILALLIYLCSNTKTYFIAWVLIGVVALFAIIKAIYEIILLLAKYRKATEDKEKENIIVLIGGRIFDIALSAIGILQAGKILRHSVRIAHALNSAFSLVDDVVAAISNVTKNFFK